MAGVVVAPLDKEREVVTAAVVLAVGGSYLVVQDGLDVELLTCWTRSGWHVVRQCVRAGAFSKFGDVEDIVAVHGCGKLKSVRLGGDLCRDGVGSHEALLELPGRLVSEGNVIWS